jgi:hypothetical protein
MSSPLLLILLAAAAVSDRGTKLLPGRHRIVVTAIDRAGNASHRRRASFRVVR